MVRTLPRNTMWAMLGILALFGTWQYGRYVGAESVMEIARAEAETNIEIQVRERVELLAQRTAPSRNALNSESAQIESLQTKTNLLEKALQEAHLNADADSAELELYRRIANTEKSTRSLSLESVSWTPTQPTALALTLIQWRGRDRVSGHIMVSLGFRKSSEPEHDSEASDEQNLLTVQSVEFQFRFFQNMAIPVEIPGDANPEFIEIRVEPDSDHVGPIVKRIAWTELLEIVD